MWQAVLAVVSRSRYPGLAAEESHSSSPCRTGDEQLKSVEDKKIPGPRGDIPVRIYIPDTEVLPTLIVPVWHVFRPCQHVSWPHGRRPIPGLQFVSLTVFDY